MRNFDFAADTQKALSEYVEGKNKRQRHKEEWQSKTQYNFSWQKLFFNFRLIIGFADSPMLFGMVRDAFVNFEVVSTADIFVFGMKMLTKFDA